MSQEIAKMPGLYHLLEETGVCEIWSGDSKSMAHVDREEVCEETGGSCMLLTTREFYEDWGFDGDSIHVTDQDEIVLEKSASFTYTRNGTEYKDTKPDPIKMRESLLRILEM